MPPAARQSGSSRIADDVSTSRLTWLRSPTRFVNERASAAVKRYGSMITSAPAANDGVDLLRGPRRQRVDPHHDRGALERDPDGGDRFQAVAGLGSSSRPAWRSALPSRSRSIMMRSMPARSASAASATSSVINDRIIARRTGCRCCPADGGPRPDGWCPGASSSDGGARADPGHAPESHARCRWESGPALADLSPSAHSWVRPAVGES